MSDERSRRGGRGQGKQQSGGGRGGTKAGAKGANRGGNKRGRQKQQQQRKPGLDPNRPFWANEPAEAAARASIGSVRPAQDPTALVRSLGAPPLGKYADNAQHYYAAVYEKAQRFALAMATANGVLVVDADDEVGADSAGDDEAAGSR